MVGVLVNCSNPNHEGDALPYVVKGPYKDDSTLKKRQHLGL